MGRTIATQTAVSGTLDICWAMALTLLYGRNIGDMLRFVGSGPFPAATSMGPTGALLGLVVHYALMALMAVAFTLWVRGRPGLLDRPIVTALVFGLATYAIMNWLVVPLRFDTPWPVRPMQVVSQLFAHIVLVGLPFALIARRARA